MGLNCRKIVIIGRLLTFEKGKSLLKYTLLVILGPTACGKTKIGIRVARALNGEIISADSRQVYRRMDIGTGKDLQEYGSIAYHLIDIVDPGYEFNVFEFQRRFIEAFAAIQKRGKFPILVGGTGMYLDAVLRGYRLLEVPENSRLRQELAALSLENLAYRLKGVNPRLHNTTDLLDRERLTRAIEIAEFNSVRNPNLVPLPELKPIVFGIKLEKGILHQRITKRLQDRLNQGMIEEVERLHRAGVPFEHLEFYGLEYRFVAKYLKGELNRNDMFQKLNSAIHRFAKRQETWFRRMERQGILIQWVDGNADPAAVILQKLKG